MLTQREADHELYNKVGSLNGRVCDGLDLLLEYLNGDLKEFALRAGYSNLTPDLLTRQSNLVVAFKFLTDNLDEQLAVSGRTGKHSKDQKRRTTNVQEVCKYIQKHRVFDRTVDAVTPGFDGMFLATTVPLSFFAKPTGGPGAGANVVADQPPEPPAEDDAEDDAEEDADAMAVDGQPQGEPKKKKTVLLHKRKRLYEVAFEYCIEVQQEVSPCPRITTTNQHGSS